MKEDVLVKVLRHSEKYGFILEDELEPESQEEFDEIASEVLAGSKS